MSEDVYIKFDSREELGKAFNYLFDNKLHYQPCGNEIIEVPDYVAKKLKKAGFNYEFTEIRDLSNVSIKDAPPFGARRNQT